MRIYCKYWYQLLISKYFHHLILETFFPQLLSNFELAGPIEANFISRYMSVLENVPGYYSD